MDSRAEIRAFLKSRRDKLTPEQAGLPVYGTRRVSGLRRGEVAMLAGVSVEYYTRLERGSLGGVSDSVLDSLAAALRLDDTERAHLYDLARAANASPGRVQRRPGQPSIRPGVRRMVEAIPSLPVCVTNNRFDVLLVNPLGRALYSEMYADPLCDANTARFVFLSPAARRFYVDWERIAKSAVGALRVEAGQQPYDRELSNLMRAWPDGRAGSLRDHIPLFKPGRSGGGTRQGELPFLNPRCRLERDVWPCFQGALDPNPGPAASVPPPGQSGKKGADGEQSGQRHGARADRGRGGQPQPGRSMTPVLTTLVVTKIPRGHLLFSDQESGPLWRAGKCLSSSTTSPRGIYFRVSGRSVAPTRPRSAPRV